MSDSSKPAISMAELMAKHKDSFKVLHKGEVVEGKITKVTPVEIVMLIDGKTEAGILEKDRRLMKQLMNLIHVGDSVSATVVTVESEMGYPLVSLRKFVDEKTWEYIDSLQKSGDKIPVVLTELTKGGFVVESVSGISGFLPNSHVTAKDPESMVGQIVDASIVEVSKENRKIVFSQKGILTESDFKNIAAKYKSGTKVTGKISGVTSFGLFVTLPFIGTDQQEKTVDGLIHISEVSWDKIEDLTGAFHMGQDVEAVVIGSEKSSKRVDLSIKRLSADPFAETLKAFPLDKKISGTVTEVNEQGVLLDLGHVGEVSVEGMIKKDKIPPTTTYEVGQKITALVSQVDNKRRKIYLTPVLLEKPLMYR